MPSICRVRRADRYNYSTRWMISSFSEPGIQFRSGRRRNSPDCIDPNYQLTADIIYQPTDRSRDLLRSPNQGAKKLCRHCSVAIGRKEINPNTSRWRWWENATLSNGHRMPIVAPHQAILGAARLPVADTASERPVPYFSPKLHFPCCDDAFLTEEAWTIIPEDLAKRLFVGGRSAGGAPGVQ